MKFLTLFLTVVLILANASHAKSVMKNPALATLRLELLTYGLEKQQIEDRLGENEAKDYQPQAEITRVYPEELTIPLARYLGK